MREYEPSGDFVSRVMAAVNACEGGLKSEPPRLWDGIFALSPVRYMMSCCGVFFGVLFIPAVCI